MKTGAKTKYLVGPNSNPRFDIIIDDDDHFKYLVVEIDKESLGDTKIGNKIQQSKRIIEC